MAPIGPQELNHELFPPAAAVVSSVLADTRANAPAPLRVRLVSPLSLGLRRCGSGRRLVGLLPAVLDPLLRRVRRDQPVAPADQVGRPRMDQGLTVVEVILQHSGGPA